MKIDLNIDKKKNEVEKNTPSNKVKQTHKTKFDIQWNGIGLSLSSWF